MEEIPGTDGLDLIESGEGRYATDEVYLSPDDANRFRDSLVVFDSSDGEPVRPDLVGR